MTALTDALIRFVVGLVNRSIDRYYLGNELRFISGFLFDIGARKTKEIVVERGRESPSSVRTRTRQRQDIYPPPAQYGT